MSCFTLVAALSSLISSGGLSCAAGGGVVIGNDDKGDDEDGGDEGCELWPWDQTECASEEDSRLRKQNAP
jgi:hypothetical protein